MKRTILFLKAKVSGGAMGDLFSQPVQVDGHVRGGTYVAPYASHRAKTMTPRQSRDADRRASLYDKAPKEPAPPSPPAQSAAPPPKARPELPPALSALADNNIYGREAWEDAWERANAGERARMEHHATQNAEAAQRGDTIRQRRVQESLDMLRAGIMERAVYQAQAAAQAADADPALTRAKALRNEYAANVDRYSNGPGKGVFFRKLREAARETKDGTTAATLIDVLATRAGMDVRADRLEFQPGDDAPAPPAAAPKPATLGTYDGMKLRELYREAVHGAGAEPRRAARAQIDAILAATGISIKDAFDRERLDLSAYFASRPIS